MSRFNPVLLKHLFVFEWDDIDDKYACINSLRESFKDEQYIAKDIIDQFIGAHNGQDRLYSCDASDDAYLFESKVDSSVSSATNTCNIPAKADMILSSQDTTENLIGQIVKNDGYGIKSVLSLVIAPESLHGGDNYVFYGQTYDGRDAAVYTSPEGEDSIIIDDVRIIDPIITI